MTDLERFLSEFMAKDHDSLAQDDDKWITIHPNGTDNRAVMIDDKTGVIKKGLAIGLIGTKLKDIRDNFKDKAKIEQHRARAEGEKAPEPVKDPEFEKYVDSLKNTKIKGFFGGVKKVYNSILKDIEERGITTMEGVNQLLKEKYPGQLPAEKKEPEKTPEPVQKKDPEFKNYYDNPVYKDNEEILSRLVNKDLSDTIQNYLKENEFSDLKDFGKFLKENNPGAYKTLQKLKEQQWFKSQSISNKFFGKNGIDHVSNKYFSVNHHPDEKTVLLEVDKDRIRTVGQDKKYVYLLDKNKAIYIKDTLPVLSWNDETKEQKLHLIAKFDINDKVYSFGSNFDATENLKPIDGFNGLVKVAEERDNTSKTYRNVPEKEIGDYYLELNSQIDNYLKSIRPKGERVTVTDAELNSYLSNWNGKLYCYGDGTKAIFSKGKKIVLTNEQYESLKPLERR